VVKIIAYAVMMLAGVGVSLCLSFYLRGLMGIYLLPPKEISVLFEGLRGMDPHGDPGESAHARFQTEGFLESGFARLSEVDEGCAVGCD
jgi:hypothetical protein